MSQLIWEIGHATLTSVTYLQLLFQTAHANSQNSQVLDQVSTKDTAKRHWFYNKTSYQLFPTQHTHKSANPTAAHVRKKLMLLTKTKQRTEPSSSKVKSPSSRPLERSKLDKPEKTAKVSQRREPSHKLTTTRVDLDLVKIALLLQYAHQNSNPTVVQQTVVLVYPSNEQIDKSSYEIHNYDYYIKDMQKSLTKITFALFYT